MMNLSSEPDAVRLDELTVSRGGRLVLDRVSLGIGSGSITGLIGPSGCGKTTLIRCLAGVQLIKAGSVTVFGRPAGAVQLRGRVGYLTQASSVYPDLTVLQNLRYFATISGIADNSAIERALADVDLLDQADALTMRLSGGQRARVSLATTLVGDPDLLLLDEPTVGLDPVLRRDLWTLFEGLAQRGKTLLVSSHVMDEAARCHRVLLMRDGGLVADDSPDGLRAVSGQQDLEQAFLRLAETDHVDRRAS